MNWELVVLVVIALGVWGLLGVIVIEFWAGGHQLTRIEEKLEEIAKKET